MGAVKEYVTNKISEASNTIKTNVLAEVDTRDYTKALAVESLPGTLENNTLYFVPVA